MSKVDWTIVPAKIGDHKGIPRTKEDMEHALQSGYVIPAFRDTSLDVELLLDYVDLKLDWYIPSVDSIKFINFIRLCVGTEPENLNPKAHYFFIDCIFQSESVKPYFTVRGIDYDALKGNTLILSTREFSKSTLIAYLLLYMADTGELPNFEQKVKFGVYVSDKMDGNVRTTMQTIEALHDESEYLRSRFEYTHFTDAMVEFIRKPVTDDEVKAFNDAMAKGLKVEEVSGRSSRRFKVQGIGSSGGRGSRNILDRPQFAIFDDMVANEKDASSQATLDAIDSTIDADIGSSLSGNGNFKVLIGTAYHTEDPVYKRVTDGAWLPIVFPKAEELPVEGFPREKFISVWEDRHSYDKQIAAYAKAETAQKNGKSKPIKTINQEFYIRVVSDHERLIPSKNIHYESVDNIWKNANEYTWYVTTDYTTSNTTDSNRSCQMLWALKHDETHYLMDLYLRRQEIEDGYRHTNEFIMKAISKGANWVDTGVEIDGQQVMHLIGLERYMEKAGTINHLSFAMQVSPSSKKTTWEGIRSKGSGDKLWRLKLFAPTFHDNKVIFNKNLIYTKTEDLDVLKREFKMTTNFEIKSSDDGLDGISQLALIDREYPIERKKGGIMDDIFSPNPNATQPSYYE